MRRRDIITLFGGAAAWPLAARAQGSSRPVVGFLHANTSAAAANPVMGFLRGLNESGFSEGRNLSIDYRWAAGQYDRLPALATELVDRRVAVLVAGGGNAPALAAKAATTRIPIVFVTGSDPVAAGLVEALNRPGGRVTGISMIFSVLLDKSLDLLSRLVPSALDVGALVNPNYSDTDVQVRELQQAAQAIKQRVHIVQASTDGEIVRAFESLAQQRAAALLVANDPFFNSRRDEIVALAARNALPAIYSSREYVAIGGHMNYAPSLVEAYRQAGVYTGKILNGASPSDLPVMQPTKFELVINLKTAKSLGLTIPPTLLALADEVIE
jgi:putative tryptophan/tyrosine transport system substrate-binding protein